MRIVVTSLLASVCLVAGMSAPAQSAPPPGYGASGPGVSHIAPPPPRSVEERLASLESRVEEQRFSWLTVFVGLSAAIVAALSLVNGRRQTLRDGMFKCFEGYLKVMDYKAKAMEAAEGPTPNHDEYQRYLAYYRALFDLLWTEYYLWKNRTLRDEPYMQWLIQRQKQFLEPPTSRQNGGAVEPISYQLVWFMLKKDGYYDAKDPFVRHMDRVHGGESPRGVLSERKPVDGWW
jgi:hypothetical protein